MKPGERKHARLRKGTNVTQNILSIDLFWSFRSPYSYLATGRLVDLQTRYALDVQVRPVLPIAVRTPEFFQRVNPLFPRYLVRDVLRLGEFLEIPIRWPRPDPVVMNPDGSYPADQPYIHRLTRLGVAAAERGCGLAFLNEVSKVIWDGSIEGWHEGTHLSDAAERAGLDLAELDEQLDRAESKRARGRRSLGCADPGVRGGALLRSGPARPPTLASKERGPFRTRMTDRKWVNWRKKK